jgi:DNA-3-methyladenine glycosylase I
MSASDKPRRSASTRTPRTAPRPPGLGVVVGCDGLARPPWAAANELLRHYYDTEWGVPVRDERGVFERISLEAFQSGLSWATILAKRPAFREAFHDFDPDTVAAYGQSEVARLLDDDRIVRNRRKIEATIRNARATIDLRGDGGLAELIWSFQPARSPAPLTVADIPTKTEDSAALARELRRRGFSFLGPTTVFALMEAIGVVDTHLLDSHRRGCSGLWSADGGPTRPRARGGHR